MPFGHSRRSGCTWDDVVVCPGSNVQFHTLYPEGMAVGQVAYRGIIRHIVSGLLFTGDHVLNDPRGLSICPILSATLAGDSPQTKHIRHLT